MPRNGSGTYTRTNGVFSGATVWEQDKAVGTKITTDHHDDHDQDIADALTQSLSKDGQTVPTANLPMGGFRHTGVQNGVARSDYAAIGQVQDSIFIWGGTSTGSGTAYIIAPSPGVAALATGQVFRFLAHADCGTNPTLQVNGLAAKNLYDWTAGFQVKAGQIVTGQLIEVVYDGTQFRIINSLINSGWSTWVPVVTPVGGGTFTVTTSKYKYRIIGKRAEYLITLLGTVSGTVTSVTLSLPSIIASNMPSENFYLLVPRISASTLKNDEFMFATANNSTFSIQRAGGLAYTVGAGEGTQNVFLSVEMV